MRSLLVSSVTASDADHWTVRVDGRIVRCPLVAITDDQLLHVKYFKEYPDVVQFRDGALVEITTPTRELVLLLTMNLDSYEIVVNSGKLNVDTFAFSVVDDTVIDDTVDKEG